MVDQVEIALTFQGESKEEAEAILLQAGADRVALRPTRGLTGIETVLVGFLLLEGTVTIVSKLLRTWKCGAIVVVAPDGRKVSTEKNCDIPRGSVILVHPDGTHVQLQEPSEPQIGAWFKDAFGAISGAA